MNMSDQLADEIYGLHCDIGRLEVENAKLRMQLADAIESMGRVEERCAKLRKLVIAQCDCVKYDDCNECVHYSEGRCTFPFESIYQELGVEVDE